MARVVVLGGTFNPLSRAHDLILRKAKERIGARKALLLPTGDGFLTSWKKFDSSSILPSKLRMDILKIYAKRHKDVFIEDMEIVGETNCTFESLRRLKKKDPLDRFYFVLGSEKIDEILTWKEAGKLLSENQFLMVRRNGDDLSSLRNHEAFRLYPNHFSFLDPGAESQEISSTKIRRLLQKGDFDSMREWTFSYVIEKLKEATRR